MTAQLNVTCASSAETTDWSAINWRTVYSSVRRIQVRIAKATKEERWGKVKSLQRLLTHSYYGKLVAVQRVTSNKGKRTSGIDGKVWSTDRQKTLAITTLKRHGYKDASQRKFYRALFSMTVFHLLSQS